MNPTEHQLQVKQAEQRFIEALDVEHQTLSALVEAKHIDELTAYALALPVSIETTLLCYSRYNMLNQMGDA